MSYVRLLSTLALCVVLDRVAAAQDQDPLARIAALAQAQIDAQRTPGLGLAILHHGELTFAGGFGFADLENEVPVTELTVFRIGSVTKQFTAAGVLRLVEDGSLGLDTRVDTLIDDFDFQGRAVLVRHLLNHTSGIPSYTDLNERWMAHLHEDLDPDEILDLVEGMPFHFEPGERFEYNNSGYVMLGQLIEEVSGKSWNDWLREQLCEPLDLTSIRYGSEDEIIPHRAQGYQRRRGGGFDNDIRFSMTHPHGAGALVATPADLVHWSRALLNGEVLSPRGLIDMTTPQKLNDGKAIDYGFGLQLGKLDDLAMISHGGGIFGFVTYLAAFPDADLHIAVNANCDGIDVGGLSLDIARILLDMPVTAPLDLPLSDAELAHCAGRFEGPLKATVRSRGARLFLQGDGQAEVPLLHQGDLRFRATFDDALSIQFDPAGDRAHGFVLTQGGADQPFTRVD